MNRVIDQDVNPIQERKRRIFFGFGVTTNFIAFFGIVLGGVLLVAGQNLIAFFVAAILWGWSELSGECGTAHVGTITPLRVADDERHLWFRSALGYTTFGLLAAAVVGYLIGSVGHIIHPYEGFGFIVVSIASLVLILRELGLIWFPLPQFRRQTDKFWAWEHGIVPAASMWGAHIGLGFATVVAHGGFYLLVMLTIFLGPTKGALLYATYWLGRTLPIWLAPKVCAFDGNINPVMQSVLDSRGALRNIAVVGMVLAGVAALPMASSSF